jgi:hypothetical protein
VEEWTMKRVLMGLCFAVVFAVSVAAFAGDQDFVLVNKTGLTIDELYVSPTHDNEWGEDVLGKDVLKNNENVEIKFSRKETACVWDIKIVDEDDDDVIWTEIDLCKASEITLFYKNGKPTAQIK